MFRTAHEKAAMFRSAHLYMHDDDKRASAHVILVLKARLAYSKFNREAELVARELQDRLSSLTGHAVPKYMVIFGRY